MPEFYHGLITQKSFEVLKDLKRKFRFILIGGWAIYLYVKSLKSKDIDMIIEYEQLEKLKNEFTINKNDRLKKYEMKIAEVDVDLYLPYFSQLGFPVEEIKKYSQSIEGFNVPLPELLLILKIFTFNNRQGTTKGQKDLIDIFSLLKEGIINWSKYKGIVNQYNLKVLSEQLKNIVSKATPMPELDLNNHQLAKSKKKILEQW